MEKNREEDPIAELIRCAMQARKKAYCPYSDFAVGAALQAKDGRIFTGCNVENAAFSPSCCAERVAFFKAVGENVTEFERIAIVGGKKGEGKVKTTPCGVCRQVMMEFCDPETFEVVVALTKKRYEVYRLGDLLPQGFRLKGGI